MDLEQYNLTKEEELELNQLMDKFRNDDEYFAQMNREVTSFMILGCRKPLNGRRPTPEEMLLALLVSGRF
tara:strand:+ start:263 stop:472 length:210 start_codon:yes stop_codon:yes gene_type:complete